MRTFKKWCAPSNELRTFEAGPRVLGYPLAGAVPFSRKVAQALASASIALFANAFVSCIKDFVVGVMHR
jgi:hypothetical protein